MSATYDESKHHRAGDGKFATKDGGRETAGQVDDAFVPQRPDIDPDVDVAAFEAESGLKLTQSQYMEETLTEGGDFTPISDSGDERGMVGYHVAEDDEGNTIEVIQKVSISPDDEKRWWVIYQDEQYVTTPDGSRFYRELGAGNVEGTTYDNPDDAWSSAQQCRDSMRASEAYSSEFFEVDLDASQESN